MLNAISYVKKFCYHAIDKNGVRLFTTNELLQSKSISKLRVLFNARVSGHAKIMINDVPEELCMLYNFLLRSFSNGT